MIVVNTGAANRDPAVFDDPDRLDIRRQGAPPIQTFGGGTHYCLGAHLALLELAEALTVMTRRMPSARRIGPAPWNPVNEHETFPPRWDAALQLAVGHQEGQMRERSLEDPEYGTVWIEGDAPGDLVIPEALDAETTSVAAGIADGRPSERPLTPKRALKTR